MESPESIRIGETPDQIDVRLNKDVAAFSYIWVMSLVVFAARKNSPFAQYHSKQGIALFLLSFVWLIPWIGHFLTVIVVAGMVLGFIHAAQGQRTDVPFVGPLSRGELKFAHVAEEILKLFQEIIRALRSLFSSAKPQITEHHTDPVSTTPPDMK